MKIGMRKPSIKKSIKARTTGKVKRAFKKSINPTYGKKGMGWVNDPKKAAYNKVYNKTTVSVSDVTMATSGKNNSADNNAQVNSSSSGCGCGCLSVFIIVLILWLLWLFIDSLF